MEFTVKLIGGRGWWLLLYVVAIAGLAVGLLVLLENTNPFLQAGTGVALLFGGGWLFWRLEKGIQQAVRVSILADRLSTTNQRTGATTTWLFEEISAYRFTPEFRGSSALRLVLRNGEKVRLIAHSAGFTDDSPAQLAAMARAFEAAWRHFKAA